MSDQFTHGYALLVGVGQSAYPAWSLPASVRDVTAIRSILTDPDLCAYPDGQVRLLHDAEATRPAILGGLAWLAERANSDPDATAVVHYAGHGWLNHATGRYYLVPHDVRPFDVASSAVSAETFAEAIGRIKARRLLVFMDCCYAEAMAASRGDEGAAMPGDFAAQALPPGVAASLKQGTGRAVFASSHGRQRSWTRPDGALGIYTHHLLEALQGAGNRPGDTLVRVSNLMNHLGRTVPESARRLAQAEQVPFFDTATEDFPVAVLRGGRGLPVGGWGAVQDEAAGEIRRVAQVVVKDVAIAHGTGARAASGRSVVADHIGAPVVTGDGSIGAGGDVIVVTDPDLLWRDIRRRPVPPPPETRYDLGAVAGLLRDAFAADELWRFCRDRAAFRPLLAGVPHDYSPEELVDRVIDYSLSRDLLDELLAEVRAVNERQYRRYADRLQPGASGPVPSETAAPGQPAPPSPDLRAATARYLEHLVDRYRYLEFRGMGISDKVALRLPLVDMYVPLKARIELPEGETWARQLRLAGRPVSAEEAEAMGARLSAPQPALDLLRAHDGLIVLGDPGAGKTTFVKYLALKLASGQGDELGLGARLPVLVPLSAYAVALETRDVPLGEFIAAYYRGRGIDLPLGPMLDEALARGGALLLLDGLDEVRDLARRGLVVQRVVDFFAFHRRQGNKFVLTSRVVGYREVRPSAEGLAECTLVDFDDEEIGLFVARWTAALERAARGDTAVAAQEAARERAELLAAVRRNPGVRRLASNPLLLTILALMKRQGVTLPERRVELYQKYVETLLKHWNLARGLGRPPARDLDVVETVRVLAPLALWMHETSPGVGLVKREAMRRRLVEIYRERAIDDPEGAARQFLADVREHAGLLVERGAGQYGFVHLTFQEYLAGVAVALQGQRDVAPVVEALAGHVGDDNWREVSQLAVGYLGIVQQRDEAAGDVLWDLIGRAPGGPGQAAVFAGEAVLDAWPGGVTPQCKKQVVDTLLETMRDAPRVEAPTRAAAGRALAKLGDPRPEATTLAGMQFCYVPPGPFWMGEGQEEHRHETLDYGYWLARYPVTNAQYRAFVEAGGYSAEEYWTAAGWRWRQERGAAGPDALDEPLVLATHPVVAVSWYGAVAFARWLTARWRGEGVLPKGWQVRLPGEAEWEKAARGGLEIPIEPAVVTLAGLEERRPPLRQNPYPKRVYPWGDQFDAGPCNMLDTGIITTSAVGCFPGGASPYGVEEMSGNVWEWCQSLYREYPYDPEDGREKLDGNGHRVVRGGAFPDFQRGVRCAYRLSGDPGYRYVGSGFRCMVAPVPL